jgi:sulfate transport system substrate-binding protein
MTPHDAPRRTRRVLAKVGSFAALSALAIGAAACSSGNGSSSGSGSTGSGPNSGQTINLVAYSTPEKAYTSLIAAFNKTSAGKGVTVSESFGPSGTQARAVAAGLPADVVNFSLSSDMDTLVKAGLVAANWDATPTHGFVTNSVVVFVVRKGNPKNIKTWDDLTKPGVEVITPNPFSSGAARWNLMAAYGAQLAQGKSTDEADAYLSDLLKNVVVQPTSASTALATFLTGKGDVLLDYESDAIAAKKKGDPIDYVIPPQDILIQNPIAVLSGSKATAAKAFETFLVSPAGQTVWGQLGYRPVLPGVAAQFSFPQPDKLFTIDTLGGWSEVKKKYFDPTDGIITRIEQGLGVSTSTS